MIPEPASLPSALETWFKSRFAGRILMVGVMLVLSAFVLRTYGNAQGRSTGWSKLIMFGSAFDAGALPRLKAIRHYVYHSPGSQYGYDGQFYAQLAIDPSLRDPAFPEALDNPSYRARRIGVPAFAFVAGLGKPRWIIQAYALTNLIAWFGLAAALLALLAPWGGQKALCLAGALLGAGVIICMEYSLTDLPATALMMAGFALGANWPGYSAFAAATLTRETSLLAAAAALDFRRPWSRAQLGRNAARFALAAAPLALWLVYVHYRFGAVPRASDPRTFSLPLQAMVGSFMDDLRLSRQQGLSDLARAAGPAGWLYADFRIHEMLTIAGLVFQGVYLVLRRDFSSPVWRTAIVYLFLGCFLGTAVWESTSAAARALLPMTVCFYLLLAKERVGWFWLFFLLGGMAIPYGVHEFWLLH